MIAKIRRFNMQLEECTHKIIKDLIIATKTAIADDREYKITQIELDRFEQQLAAVDPKDPNLHPRLILGRINSFKRTIDRLKQEIADYERNNGIEIT